MSFMFYGNDAEFISFLTAFYQAWERLVTLNISMPGSLVIKGEKSD